MAATVFTPGIRAGDVSYFLDGITRVSLTRDGGYLLSGTVALCCSYLGTTSFTDQYGWLLKLGSTGNVEWSQVYGENDPKFAAGGSQDGFLSAHQTSDGGFIVGGMQWGSVDSGWVLRLDSTGNIIWQEKLAGHVVSSVSETKDGDFIISGWNFPSSPLLPWVARMNPFGGLEWQKAFDFHTSPLPGQRELVQRVFSAEETTDKGFIVIGQRTALGRDEEPLHSDALVFKLRSDGDILWASAYDGGSGWPSVQETSNGGYLVADGPALLRLDARGNLVWQKKYDGAIVSARETRDHGIIVVGSLRVAGQFTSPWAAKVDSQGNLPGCPVGTSANGTLTETSVVTTDTAIASVKTNASVILTDLVITSPTFAMQDTCSE